MVNRLNLIDLSISLYGTWIWRPDVNSNLSKSPFCWFWRLTSWFIPAKKLKSTWGADIIIYHVPSYIPTEMFFFVCHHHGKQVVKFGSKRVLVCSFYLSHPLPQMNVSRVLEDNFIRRFENIMFFSHHFWKKNGVSYMPAFLLPDPVVLSQTTQTRQQFSTKKRLDWTSWQRFGSSQSISTIWWCSWESLRQTSNMSLHLIIARHIIKHILLNAKLRILKLDLLSGALWTLCIWHNTHWRFFAARCKTI